MKESFESLWKSRPMKTRFRSIIIDNCKHVNGYANDERYELDLKFKKS